MKSSSTGLAWVAAFVIAATAGLGWMAFNRLQGTAGPGDRNRSLRPVPVEVAPILHGSIAQRRMFSGELEALAEFVVDKGSCRMSLPGQAAVEKAIGDEVTVVQELNNFVSAFSLPDEGNGTMVDGVFGYSTYDAVQYFEDIRFQAPLPEK